mmetsp:Transcript_38469/g.108721  ORF Transcript_38469/g.108721 Transcript_38469/m.108721 type:complete len:748 (+) Transcript_38469:93-2336(+)|eukprot:CAMPEP_0117648876 /NCGR_PEP_ID=MMETSP0804-20121206/655_1 /TAXON_ID=1074897 /ORGANISM="Tetraselmis astigmatica, Strain CCMP880" /LENGTH=747 /DNA_ID=CAMNT_0005454541 /DNA_START=80 /DNA_END=2323 /DNA_ORIENTATION=-
MPWEAPAVTTSGHQAGGRRRGRRRDPTKGHDANLAPTTSPHSQTATASSVAVAPLKPFKLNPSACEFIPAALRSSPSPVNSSHGRSVPDAFVTTPSDPTVPTGQCQTGTGHLVSKPPTHRRRSRKPGQDDGPSQRDGSLPDELSPDGHSGPTAAAQLDTSLPACQDRGMATGLVSSQHPSLSQQPFRMTELPTEVLSSIVTKLHSLQDVVALAAANKMLHTLVSHAPLSLSVSQPLSNSLTPLEHDGARSSQIVSAIRTQFKGLQQLDLQGCAVGDDDVVGLLVSLPRLERLTLSGCKKLSFQAAGRILQGAAGKATRLRCLNMQRCFQLNTKSMEKVLSFCSKEGQGVKCLAFSHLTMAHWPAQATSPGLVAGVALPALSTQLTVLALNCCDNMTTQGLQAIAAACPQLEHLLLGGSTVQPTPATAESQDRAAVARMVEELLASTSIGRAAAVGAVATELILTAQKLPHLQTLELSFFYPGCTYLCEQLVPACTQQRVSVLNLCGHDLHRHPLATTSPEASPGCSSDLASVLCGPVNCSNAVRQSPLHIAAELAQLKNAKVLLQWGAAVDPRDRSGATPLFVACEHGHELLAACLLDAGADPMRSNNSGESPLYIACLRGHWRVVEVLLQHLLWNNIPWELGEVYSDGWTPLMAATVGDHFNVSMLLLRAAGPLASSLIGATNRYGQTAIHLAARRGSILLLRAMLQLGAGSSAAVVDNTGATAADIAGYHGHKEMQRILQSCLAA